MNVNKPVSLIGGIVASLMLANSAQASCDMAAVGHMYLSYARQITMEESPAEAYKAVKAELQALAEDQEVENFSITSSDMSVSAGGYSRGLNLHISVGAQMAPNADVIDAFFRETQPESFSYSESVCMGYGEDEETEETEGQAL